MSNLAPCPFCGNENVQPMVNDATSDGNPLWWVECDECGCEGPFSFATAYVSGEEAARNLWNTRASVGRVP
jgi:Lar family restriction alleviation protein